MVYPSCKPCILDTVMKWNQCHGGTIQYIIVMKQNQLRARLDVMVELSNILL